MFRIKLCLVLFISGFFFTINSQAEKMSESILEGVWIQVDGEVDGHKQGRQDVNTSRFTFMGDSFQYSTHGSASKGKFTIKGSKSQGAIDFYFNEGKASGKETFCLYRLNDNVLHMSILKEKNSELVSAELQFQKQKDVESKGDMPAEISFVGKYTSESFENFGPENDVFTINLIKVDDGYQLAYFKDNKSIFSKNLKNCSEKALQTEYYHTFALQGKVQALCGDKDSVDFFYAENGIELSEPYVPKRKVYKAKFYSNVGWAIYGFKKLPE